MGGSLSSAPDSAPASASLWEQLLKTALLGSERTPVPVPAAGLDVPLAQVLAQVKTENREAALLSSAALVATYERCGMIPMMATELSLSTAPVDALPRCGPGAAASLRRILGGQFPFLMTEFLTALRELGKRVPEELLPDVLEAARKNADLRPAVLPVVGHRGEWLAALNPEWSFIAAQIAPSEWETGTRAGRVALLRHLRHTDPRQAVELLQSTWSSDAFEDRAAFLVELEHGLTFTDEAFLEAALDDRRKEIRRRACDLLLRLPQSALVERMWQRVAPIVRLEKSSGLNLKKLLGKQALEVELPQICDDAMKRDGIEPQPPEGMGEKSWWLQQMVRSIPPARWEKHLQLSPQQYVDAAGASEFGNALVPAIAEAAKRHRDARWAKPVAELAMVRARESAATPGAFMLWAGALEAVTAMNEEDRDALTIRQIDRHGEMTDFVLGLKLLHSCPGPWSTPVAKSFLDLLRHFTQQMAAEKIQPYWTGLGDLTVLGSRLPVSIAQEAQQGWPEDAATKVFFKPVQTILETLQFRSKMLREIKQ
jgi:hypothetical protein